MSTILAWHFLPDDGRIPNYRAIFNHTTRKDGMVKYAGFRPKAGQTLRVDPPIILCEHGLHASIRPLDALRHAPGSVICRVECAGEIVHGHDKLACSERTIVAKADATRLLHTFACDVAEDALRKYHTNPRSLRAIEVKRLWLDGKATDHELYTAANAAMYSALERGSTSPRRAAWYAAWADARKAARNAASNAAEVAPTSTAFDAIRDAQNQTLEALLLDLLNLK